MPATPLLPQRCPLPPVPAGALAQVDTLKPEVGCAVTEGAACCSESYHPCHPAPWFLRGGQRGHRGRLHRRGRSAGSSWACGPGAGEARLPRSPLLRASAVIYLQFVVFTQAQLQEARSTCWLGQREEVPDPEVKENCSQMSTTREGSKAKCSLPHGGPRTQMQALQPGSARKGPGFGNLLKGYDLGSFLYCSSHLRLASIML